MRRAACALAVVALAAGCGGDDAERDAVKRYIEQANRAQSQFEPDVRAAQAAIRAFSTGRAGPQLAERLRRGAATMRNARAALALLEPPAKALSLHDRQLELLALQARLSQELSLAAGYLPHAVAAIRPADEAGARLAAALQRAEDGATQASALARYVERVDEVLARLEALGVPPVLAPWHAAQVARLEASRKLAAGLAGGIRAQDRGAIDRALHAFADDAPSRGVAQRAQRDAVRLFNARLARQQRLLEAIFRAQGELALEFGS